MSIYDEIDYRIAENRLFLVAPTMPGAAVVRRIYISPEINNLLVGPWDDAKWEARCGSLRADFDRFIEGRLIPIAVKPYKGKTSYMLQLNPPRDEVWEIRSRDPKPSIRVFGRFAHTDVFIALTWSPRAGLGPRTSRNWRDAKVTCKTEWGNLFPAYQPKSGANIHDYISANTFLI